MIDGAPMVRRQFLKRFEQQRVVGIGDSRQHAVAPAQQSFLTDATGREDLKWRVFSQNRAPTSGQESTAQIQGRQPEKAGQELRTGQGHDQAAGEELD